MLLLDKGYIGVGEEGKHFAMLGVEVVEEFYANK